MVVTGEDGKKYIVYNPANVVGAGGVNTTVGSGVATTTKSTTASGSEVTDLRIGGKIVSRVYVKSSQADALAGAVTTTTLTGERIDKAHMMLAKYYRYVPMHVVSYDNQAKFPGALESAIRLPADVGNAGLALYCYDIKANTITRLKNTNMRFDSSGFLHFNTDRAGELIITRGLLEKK